LSGGDDKFAHDRQKNAAAKLTAAILDTSIFQPRACMGGRLRQPNSAELGYSGHLDCLALPLVSAGAAGSGFSM
jgi:hypothetical protein